MPMNELAVGFTRRRQLAWLLGALASTLPGAAGARGPGDVRVAATAPAAARDRALRAMRATELTPSWFTSANWDNRHYQPWTDYLVGRIGEAEFAQVCASPSDYCLRDVWNLRREQPARIDWSAQAPFNWNGIHALALRFFRSGEEVYLRKWLAVVADFAAFALAESGRAGTPVKRGTPAALLDTAMVWGGIFTALAIVAKGLRPSPPGASPYAAVAAEVASAELERVPAAQLLGIAEAFASGPAPDLARFHASPAYVPNQRAFGLEALAFAAAFFPDAQGVAAWRPTVHTALIDLVDRYRLPDGGQLEPSFNYAQSLVESTQRLAQLPFAEPPPWLEGARRTATGWWRMAAALAVPGGGLPQLGNAAWGRFGRGGPAVRFATTSMAFPYGGLYAMRSSWQQDASYLFFFQRRAARGHGMAGSNSIQVAAFGRQLLAAGGSAIYGGPGAARPDVMAYLAEGSSYKTNTVIVDGRSQAGGSLQGLATGPDGKPDITRAATRPIAARWHASDDFDVVDGEYREGYRDALAEASAPRVTDVVHSRRIVFVRPLSLWVVVDVMRTAGAHDYTQVWKFPPPGKGQPARGFGEAQVQVRAGDRVVETADAAPGAANVRLQHFGIAGLQYERHFGQGRFGWHAAGPLSAPEPAVDVHARWPGSGPQVLVTVITPFRGPAAALTGSRDLSAPGLAGCRLSVAGGSGHLSVLAGTEPRALSAGGVSERGELLVVLEAGGALPRGVVLSADTGFRFQGRERFGIDAPRGFRWSADAGGILRALYDTTG